ncbi:non-homologous end-joining DNA ligase [Conexibacter sp. JD483]|nr:MULTISPECIES: non-homologous end-joining DNA ligase [unclassified Conexibacter]MDO8185376.1 non-homologous end-joining DNA ligase [Conexibacter sp. CPCC 205706]MDO8198448.1 non-homologous end-joining DNA ligase [Conexibacter sp. CPCC 205762]MDR9368787.1 non-homologous end-joining DNA ligase [Conexibacter sp. JD483]
MASAPVAIELDDHVVEVSKPSKALFASGVTKLDLARYMEAVAPALLRHVADRPLNLQRFPDGVDKHGIFQQQLPSYFPHWIDRTSTPKQGGSVTHVVATDAATLVYLANQACVSLHMWLSRRDRLDRPDRLILDLDPSGGNDDDVRQAALTIGAILRDELGLPPFALATGSRGYHVVVPLQRRHEHDEVRAFARDLGRLAVVREPRRLTLAQRRINRGGRILVDVQRNAYAHTAVAPYSVRALPAATCAAPLAWEELEERRMRPDRWSIRSLPARLARDGDPWEQLAADPQPPRPRPQNARRAAGRGGDRRLSACSIREPLAASVLRDLAMREDALHARVDVLALRVSRPQLGPDDGRHGGVGVGAAVPADVQLARARLVADRAHAAALRRWDHRRRHDSAHRLWAVSS